MQKVIKVETHSREGLYDITSEVKNVVAQSNIKNGIVNIYVRGIRSRCNRSDYDSGKLG